MQQISCDTALVRTMGYIGSVVPFALALGFHGNIFGYVEVQALMTPIIITFCFNVKIFTLIYVPICGILLFRLQTLYGDMQQDGIYMAH